MSLSGQQKQLLAENEEWTKAAGSYLVDLRAKTASLEEAAQYTAFWQKWSLQGDLSSVRKNMTIAEVRNEFKHQNNVEKAIENLENLTKRIVRLHAASLD